MACKIPTLLSCTLLFAILVLISQSSHNLAEAIPRSRDETEDSDSISIKLPPVDDTYPDIKNTTGSQNATTTDPVIQFTKTWPGTTEPTETSGAQEVSGTFPDPEYIRLLDASFMFYEAQRSGKLPPDQRVNWRNDSGLLDGKDAGQDLTGGYYDAGDYIKFIFPLTFTLTQVCYSALEFYDGYQLSNQTHYLDQMVRWGTDWLIKAHPNNNTLYVQVAVDEVDNNYWGPDTSIPTPRPSYFVSLTKPGTDVMMDAAAAFASCSTMYREKLNDTKYADTLQIHAEALFNLAETAMPQQVYQAVVPAASCCYPSTGYIDELAWGAAWMFRMTKDQDYAAKALRYVDQMNYKNGVVIQSISWDDKSGLTYILMTGLTKNSPDGAKWQSLAEKFAAFTVNPRKPCVFTKGGMYYCFGESGSNSAAVVANAAFAMALLSNNMESATTAPDGQMQEKIDSYKKFAVRQTRYLLGDNPEKTPYIVGIHPNSPVNPHSSLAAGGRSTGSIDTYPEKEAHVLLGALVGGADRYDRFFDIRSNWRQTEVALDYNAPFTGLMAYQVMTSREPPPYIHIPAGRPDHAQPNVGGMGVWKFVVLMVLIIVVLLAIGIIVYRRKKSSIRYWLDVQRQKHSYGRTAITLNSRPGSELMLDRAIEAAVEGRGEKSEPSSPSSSSSPSRLDRPLELMSSSETLLVDNNNNVGPKSQDESPMEK
ncbi:hypothetical protein BGZ76_009657 [Entomortierella beljakovae]|nr:hypothetical protein BGZ76_009657 [Entomortierella beljakovae]